MAALTFADLKVGKLYHLTHRTEPERSSEVSVLRFGSDDLGRASMDVRRSSTGRKSRILQCTLDQQYTVTAVDAPHVPEVETPAVTVDLTTPEGSRAVQVAAWTVRLAKLIGADADRHLRIDSRLLADLQGRNHRDVLKDLRAEFEDVRGSTHISNASFRDAYGREQPCLEVDVDAAIWLLSERGRTEQALIIRDAVRQLVGEQGRGEDTEATRAGSEARGDAIDVSGALRVFASGLAATMGAEMQAVRAEVAEVRGHVESRLAEVESKVTREATGALLPLIDEYSFSALKRGDIKHELEEVRTMSATEFAAWARSMGCEPSIRTPEMREGEEGRKAYQPRRTYYYTRAMVRYLERARKEVE